MAVKNLVIALLIVCTLTLGAVDSRASGEDFSDPVTQKAILALARRAFNAYALNRTVIDQPSPLPAFMSQRCGVFISTMRWGAPRTCMGTLYPCQANLAQEIIQNAVASAGRDRRFAPVKPEELSHLNLIVSIILGTPTPISASQASSLDPVEDGLAVLNGDRYGIVLSGETTDAANMVKWGCIRAGAKSTSPVRYFDIHDVRFMESQFQ